MALDLGKYILNQTKRRIPERYKGRILSWLGSKERPEFRGLEGQAKVVIALAGFYQNLGDVAITYAQKRFIEETFPDHKVVLFPSADTYTHMRALQSVVGPDDIITIIGGGNMDDIYSSLEDARRFVIQSFPKNPIISFPQTMSFSRTPEGQRALRRTVSTYSSHPNLTVFAREPHSFNLMEKALKDTRLGLVPDIVLSLSLTFQYRERAGVMLAIRDDIESLLTAQDRNAIKSIAEEKVDDVIVRDTIDIEHADCQPATYEKTLENFWEMMGSKKVVVTDRLHGLIFCIITQTPVIVLPNSNHKIQQSYEAWMSEISFVRYMDKFDAKEFSRLLQELLVLKLDENTESSLKYEFDPLRKALLEAKLQSVL